MADLGTSFVDTTPQTTEPAADNTLTPYNGVRSIFGNASDSNQVKDNQIERERATSKSKLADETVAPFLAKHIPSQYAPLGTNPSKSIGTPPPHMNSRYCYRHRPDLKCRRQADEPSMDHLQWVRSFSPSGLYRLIVLFD